MSISLVRKLIQGILAEDVYDRGSFSPARLSRNISGYASGELPQMGVSPEVATDVTLDDLLVAFGESGYDSDAELVRAVSDHDRSAAENRIRDILRGDFIGRTGPLAAMGLGSLEDILLLGDEDRLVKMILDDMFDGDEMITLH